MKINSVFVYCLIIIFAPLIGKLLKKLLDYYKLYVEYRNPISLIDITHRLTPYEFEIWASEYLSFIGYNNISLTGIGPDGGKDIICYKDGMKYYVECKRYSTNNLITTDILEKLLGSMIGDNISNGIIFTTSRLSKESQNFIKTLAKPYNIEILSANELDCAYDDFVLKLN